MASCTVRVTLINKLYVMFRQAYNKNCEVYRKISSSAVILTAPNTITSRRPNVCGAVLLQPSCLQLFQHARFKSDLKNENFILVDSDVDDANLDEEAQYESIAKQYSLLPGEGHRVFLIQPSVKWGPRKSHNTTPQLQMAEAVTLAETLEDWKVVEKIVVSIKSPDKKFIFGSGSLETLKAQIHGAQAALGVSALFISVDMLTGLQHESLEKEFGLPVFDRYTVVLKIFQDHAHTKEAKMQVALAEIPYLRSRLRGDVEVSPDRQGGRMPYLKGSGETYFELRKRLLMERELKLKKSLATLRKHRTLLRQGRHLKEFPIVAVVGYTNAGKTCLIKALTGEIEIQPKDQLFATLDVTAHAGVLPNSMTVIFIDTVGFISDIPTSLIESFAATLEDIALADLIVHVRDVSHPDYTAQKDNVHQTLRSLALPSELLETMIEVDNKADLIPSGHNTKRGESDVLCPVSATTGLGLTKLREAIQNHLMQCTGRAAVTLRVPSGGDEARWVYKEMSVMSSEADPDDPQYLRMQVIGTDAALGKFKHRYGNMIVESTT